MIAVARPTKVPAILAIRGKIADDKNRKAMDADPKAVIKIKNAIYGDTTVKSKLKKAQHGKCCFCEKEQIDEYGAVEHYRPKAGYYKTSERVKGVKMTKPGYYWLGYSWDNLLFVCQSCNTAKGNLFPLDDEVKRAKTYKNNLADETPLLLDPCGIKKPTDHISFDSLGWARSTEKFGDSTIKICKLNRDGLINKRCKMMDDIDSRIAILVKKDNHTKKDVDNAITYLKRAVTPKAEFSSLAISYLNSLKVVIT